MSWRDLGLDRGAVGRQHGLDVAPADDLAHRAFGDGLHRSRRVLDVEDVVLRRGRIDLPLHDHVDVDDVLVAGQHQAFLDHVGLARGAHGFDGAEADLGGDDVRDLRLDHAADRIGPVIVQAFAGLADELAETQIEADLVRPHDVPAGHQPEHDQHENAEDDAAPADIAAGHQVLQPVLAATQDFLEIRRGTSAARAAAPGTAAAASSALAPGSAPATATAALVAPRHNLRRPLPFSLGRAIDT